MDLSVVTQHVVQAIVSDTIADPSLEDDVEKKGWLNCLGQQSAALSCFAVSRQ